MDENMNISVIIPTWNRSELVDVLLQSLYLSRKNYKYGIAEVIIVDSSEGEERQNIINSCKDYDAIYIEGVDSVRKKRNKGITSAQYPFILFIDSDVRVDKNILNLHMEMFNESKGENLGGTFGITEFVGKNSFFWNVVKYTTFVDSFSFAKKFPYQSWTIGNNVMFRKSVLEEVNMFEEAFPFKLGGDDLDMSYRITKAGYKIKSVPDAVTWHSNETWNHIKSVNDRAKRWGTMEYYLQQRHPEIFVAGGIKAELFDLVILLFYGLLSLVMKDWIYLIGGLLTVILTFLGIYIMDSMENKQKNIIYYILAKMFEARYYYFHALEGLKHKSLCGIYKTMSFSYYQTRAMMTRESRKMWIMFWMLVIGAIVMLICFRIR